MAWHTCLISTFIVFWGADTCTTTIQEGSELEIITGWAVGARHWAFLTCGTTHSAVGLARYTVVASLTSAGLASSDKLSVCGLQARETSCVSYTIASETCYMTSRAKWSRPYIIVLRTTLTSTSCRTKSPIITGITWGASQIINTSFARIMTSLTFDWRSIIIKT